MGPGQNPAAQQFGRTLPEPRHGQTWTEAGDPLDDLPVTDLMLDPATGDLYAATDFGVLKLETGSTAWLAAGPDMPMVEVADLTIDSVARKLYAATHGRADGLEAERMLTGVLAPMLNRPVDELKQKLPIGPAEECAAKLVGVFVRLDAYVYFGVAERQDVH